MKIAILGILSLLTALEVANSVTNITHRGQLVACLNTCQQEVTACINLRHDRCLKSYHTCLSKARDIFKCFKSSKFKQLSALAQCFEQRCQEVEEIVITYEDNPLRTAHRQLPYCRPWIKGKITYGFIRASQQYYQQSELTLCKAFNLKSEIREQRKKFQKGGVDSSCRASRANLGKSGWRRRKFDLLERWQQMSK